MKSSCSHVASVQGTFAKKVCFSSSGTGFKKAHAQLLFVMSWGSLLLTHNTGALFRLTDLAIKLIYTVAFSFLMQDSVQQWWCTGQRDREGTSGRGLWDMWQRFRWAYCSALWRTHHRHQDVPEHHRAYHHVPQQDQTGGKERIVCQNECWPNEFGSLQKLLLEVPLKLFPILRQL